MARSLAGRGYSVRALARGGVQRRSGLEELPVELVAGDLASSAELEAALRGCAAVVHAAGLLKARTLEDYREVNLRGTERLLRAAAASCPEAVFVYVSTQAAAGPARDGRPLTEADPPRPVSWYGITKLEAEEAVAAGWRGPWIVLRPGVLYGPRDHGLLQYFRMAAKGVLPVPAAQTRVHVEAVEPAAEAIAIAAGRPDLSGRRAFLTDPQPVTVGALAREIARTGGRPARIFEVPDAVVRVAGALETIREALTRRSRPFNADKAKEILAGDWLCDPTPMRRDLALPDPPALDEGLRRTWDWYRREGWVGDLTKS